MPLKQYLGVSVVAATLLVGSFFASATVSAASNTNTLPQTGWSFVSVDACKKIPGGISVALPGNPERVTLLHGPKDDGFGLRQYSFYCVEQFTYVVSWRPVASDAAPVVTPTTTEESPSSTTPTATPKKKQIATCPATELEEGEVTICRKGVITHTSTGIRATVKRIHGRYTAVRLEHADRNALVIRQNRTYYVRGENDRIVALEYKRIGKRPIITFTPVEFSNTVVDDTTTSTSTMSCGDSKGKDGLYSGCVGDSIFHISSRMKIAVTNYTSERLSLSLENSDSTAIILEKGIKTTVISTSGKRVELTYDAVTEKHGAFITVTTLK